MFDITELINGKKVCFRDSEAWMRLRVAGMEAHFVMTELLEAYRIQNELGPKDTVPSRAHLAAIHEAYIGSKAITGFGGWSLEGKELETEDSDGNLHEENLRTLLSIPAVQAWIEAVFKSLNEHKAETEKEEAKNS